MLFYDVNIIECYDPTYNPFLDIMTKRFNIIYKIMDNTTCLDALVDSLHGKIHYD